MGAAKSLWKQARREYHIARLAGKVQARAAALSSDVPPALESTSSSEPETPSESDSEWCRHRALFWHAFQAVGVEEVVDDQAVPSPSSDGAPLFLGSPPRRPRLVGSSPLRSGDDADEEDCPPPMKRRSRREPAVPAVRKRPAAAALPPCEARDTF